MSRDALFARILHAVDRKAYFTPTTAVDPAQREALDLVRHAMAQPGFVAADVQALIHDLEARGRIDRLRALSASCVLASHPSVADYALAGRLCGEQEVEALRVGGSVLDANLASVARHRGVVAFLLDQPEVALEHFTLAFERQRTPENLGNVLAALCRQGLLDEADHFVVQARASMSVSFTQELDAIVDHDPDLAVLRYSESA